MRTSRKARWALAAAALALIAALAILAPLVPTMTFLWSIAGDAPPRLSWIVGADPASVTTRDIDIPTRHGPLVSRVYSPTPSSPSTILVVPGVHAGGLDEPRQTRFSRLLAATGVTVVVAPLPDLRAFHLTPRSTDQIEDAARWLLDSRLAPDRTIALAGISFAGGLATVAAGRPSVADRIRVVLSLGGHGDIGRVLRYFATGLLPDGSRQAPHDYSVAMAALAAAPLMVPPEQVAPLDRGIRLYLEAAFDTSDTREEATRLIAAAREEAARLGDPAAAILAAVARRDVSRVGQSLAPAIDALAADPALSPERSPPPRAPVFLVHGAGDTVIPASETLALAGHLRRMGHTRVNALVTPLLTHVGLRAEAGLADYWRLATFWRSVRRGMDGS
jgi:dienelactone hydrolase